MIEDLAVIVGGVCVSYGCYQIAPCLAWIVGGSLLLLVGLAVARKKNKKAKKP